MSRCKKVNGCGHQCTLRCHEGNCPPCLEIVTKICACGKEISPNVYCNQQAHSCGIICGLSLPCGHNCSKVCHKLGECFPSREDLIEKGCSAPCGKPLKYCKHRCQESCHPSRDCEVDTPCEAEIRNYCKCGVRFVNTICKSIPDRELIECNSECWKK
jgi:transcriptional repressor NF-X1